MDVESIEKIETEVLNLMMKELASSVVEVVETALEEDAGDKINDDDSVDSLDALRKNRGTCMPTPDMQQNSPEQK